MPRKRVRPNELYDPRSTFYIQRRNRERWVTYLSDVTMPMIPAPGPGPAPPPPVEPPVDPPTDPGSVADPEFGTIWEDYDSGTDPNFGAIALNPDLEPCPTPNPALTFPPTCLTYQELRNQTAVTVDDINRYRIDRGMQPLLWSDHLACAAQWHASDLYDRWETAYNSMLNHIAPEPTPHGATPGVRVTNAGFNHDPGTVNEGISGVKNWLGTVEDSYCNFKSEYNAADECNSAHFNPMICPLSSGLTHIGIGFKSGLYVYVYATRTPPNEPLNTVPLIEDPDLICP